MTWDFLHLLNIFLKNWIRFRFDIGATEFSYQWEACRLRDRDVNPAASANKNTMAVVYFRSHQKF